MHRMSMTGIGDVTVDKAALLEKLRTNRDAHRAVFEQALVAFREQAIRGLDALIVEVKAGKVKMLHVGLPVPEEHTADYDRAIRMLEMHISETVVLSEEAYAQLVDDEWGWRSAFLSNTASYVSTR